MSDIKRVEFQVAGQRHVLTPTADQSTFYGANTASNVPIGSAVTYTGKVTVVDEAGNQVSLTGDETEVLRLTVRRTAPAQLQLIYDRTQEDVDRLYALKRKILTEGLNSLTPEEKAEYMGGMRGAYNASDLNRVGQAVAFIAERFINLPAELAAYREEKGVADDELYHVPYNPATVVVYPKQDWSVADVPTQSQIQTYLNNLAVLRRQLALPADAPAVPSSLNHLTYQTANDIEYLLVLIYEEFLVMEEGLYQKIDRAAEAFMYAGEVYCGE